MTKQEAIFKMKEGFKLTHRYFTSSEFITQRTIAGKEYIVDEFGNQVKAFDFWRWRTQKAFDKDWSIYKDSE